MPDTPYVSLSLPDGDVLAQSMLMLAEGEDMQSSLRSALYAPLRSTEDCIVTA